MRPIAIPRADVCAAYAAGQTTVALARRYQCSPTTIAKRLRAWGVAVRPARFRPAQLAREPLRRLYEDERLPIAAIAAHFGVAPSTVDNWRRHYGIPVRGRRRAALLYPLDCGAADNELLERRLRLVAAARQAYAA